MGKQFVTIASGAVLSSLALPCAADAAVVSFAVSTSLSAGLNYGINMETGNVHLGDQAGDDVFLLAGSSFFVIEQQSPPGSQLARLTGTSAPSSLPAGFVLGAAMSGAGWGAGSAVSFAAGAPGAFARNATNYVGVRFAGSSGAYRYGYLTLQMGSTNSQCTVTGIAYEDSGGSITIVPAPGALAACAIAFAVGGRRRR